MEKAYQRLRRFWNSVLIGSLALPILLLLPCPSVAQELRLVSDEEAEQLISDIAKPLFAAADQPFDRSRLFLVEDPTLNAFVADGNRLFIHTGTILAAESPDELAGVIAHETGHIQGGHILRQKINLRNLQDVSLVSAILAGTAAVLGGQGDAAAAAVLGTQSSMLHQFAHYRTEEERSADEAAVRLLEKTHQPASGMLAFMKKIAVRQQLEGISETPYFRTHPLSQERLTFFEDAAKRLPARSASPLQERFERVKAKFSAYLNPPERTLRTYPAADQRPAARYARAIAYFKKLQFASAIGELDFLLAAEPDNPYFHELKGQILLETGKIKPAKAEYQKAATLKPDAALLKVSFAQTLLEDAPTAAEIKEAINLLNQAVIRRPTGFAWLLLARAYGMQGNEAAAAYAAAEYSARIGALDTALGQLEQASRARPDRRLALRIEDLRLRLDSLKKK